MLAAQWRCCEASSARSARTSGRWRAQRARSCASAKPWRLTGARTACVSAVDSATSFRRWCPIWAEGLSRRRAQLSRFRLASASVRRIARRRSVASAASDAIQSARGVAASSAAAVGVAARMSAAKSAMVKSVSWPTPEITGMLQPAIARATTSSLKLHRSSIEPPPRHTSSTSTSARCEAVAMASAMFCGRALALHRRRVEHDAHVRRAALQRGQHVAQRGRLRAGDDADRCA